MLRGERRGSFRILPFLEQETTYKNFSFLYYDSQAFPQGTAAITWPKVKSGMSYLPILEILNEVDGEEAFAHAAFPVEDEQQLFLHIFGSSMNSTFATCGPVERSRSGVAGLD